MYALFFSAFSSQCQRIPKRPKHISQVLCCDYELIGITKERQLVYETFLNIRLFTTTRDVPELKVKQLGLTQIEWTIN